MEKNKSTIFKSILLSISIVFGLNFFLWIYENYDVMAFVIIAGLLFVIFLAVLRSMTSSRMPNLPKSPIIIFTKIIRFLVPPVASIGALYTIFLIGNSGMYNKTFSLNHSWLINPVDQTFTFSNFFLKHNFAITLITTTLFLQICLRRRFLKNQTWKKISENWLKWQGIPAMSTGGFGFVAMNDEISKPLLKITSDSIDIDFLVTTYICGIIIVAFAHLFVNIGKSISNSEDNNLPKKWFLPAFACAWTSNLILYALFFDSVLLTLHAHLNK